MLYGDRKICVVMFSFIAYIYGVAVAGRGLLNDQSERILNEMK